MQSLTTYIQHPEQLNAEAVQNLEQLVERHPSFQPARLLYLLGLYQLQDARFGTELRKAALCLPDRRKLFEFFDNDHFQIKPKEAVAVKDAKVVATIPGADRTQSLIDSFLNQLPESSQPRHNHPTDASVDYMSYLMQLEDAKPVQNFDKSEEDEDTLPRQEEQSATPTPFVHQNGPSDTYFTETLARIYIKQGKYAKAIEIIRRISLIYPKKNRYFADQIRFLEKLIVNERAQNEDNNK